MRGAGCLLGWGGNGWKGVDGTATGFKSAWGSRRWVLSARCWRALGGGAWPVEDAPRCKEGFACACGSSRGPTLTDTFQVGHACTYLPLGCHCCSAKRV